MKTTVVLVLALTALATAADIWPASNTPDGKHLLFPTKDAEIPFPTTSADDLGQMIPHGAHCATQVTRFQAMPPDNDVDRMHNDHCLCLLERMVQYIEAKPHYHIDEDICELIRGARLSDDGDYYVNYQYGYGFINTTGEGSAKAVYAMLTQTARKDPQFFSADMFGLISGQNLGDLLLKEYVSGRASLSATEAAFVAKWWTRRVIGLGAMGVTCMGISNFVHGPHSHALTLGETIVAHGNYHAPVDKMKQMIAAGRYYKPGFCAAN